MGRQRNNFESVSAPKTDRGLESRHDGQDAKREETCCQPPRLLGWRACGGCPHRGKRLETSHFSALVGEKSGEWREFLRPPGTPPDFGGRGSLLAPSEFLNAQNFGSGTWRERSMQQARGRVSHARAPQEERSGVSTKGCGLGDGESHLRSRRVCGAA